MKRKEKKSLCPLNLWGQRLGELHSDSYPPVAARRGGSASGATSAEDTTVPQPRLEIRLIPAEADFVDERTDEAEREEKPLSLESMGTEAW